MNDNNKKAIIEAMLYAAGREIDEKEFMGILELNKAEFEELIFQMKDEYRNRGIEIIKIDTCYQLCSKKEYAEYIYPLFDKRSKPNLSNSAMETLSIIAYNPNITRSEIEAIRGVGSDATMYKLLEYNLIEEAGKLDIPGKPMSYVTTPHFLKTFGMESLDNLPELPKFKLNDKEQIVLIENENDNTGETSNSNILLDDN